MKHCVVALALFALIGRVHAADDGPLFEAIKRGDKATIEARLAQGVDVNDECYGASPLHWAAKEGRKDVVELLLAKGADVNSVKSANTADTPLHSAAYWGSSEVAELLLSRGAKVNARSNSDSTPLHSAALGGSKDVAALLLSKGADVNARDKSGTTPLHNAVVRGREVADLLLAKGADATAKDRFDHTALHEATAQGKTEIAGVLEDHIVRHTRNHREALMSYAEQLKRNPNDGSARRLILKFVGRLNPAPAIPEEARRHFVEGSAIVKAAKNPAQQALAAQSFNEALKVAPWWGDAYYNLGVAQDLAENYDEAERAFNHYLLTNPSESEKRDVQDRIYGLAAKRKLSGAK